MTKLFVRVMAERLDQLDIAIEKAKDELIEVTDNCGELIAASYYHHLQGQKEGIEDTLRTLTESC